MNKYIAKSRKGIKYPMRVTEDISNSAFKGEIIDFPEVGTIICDNLSALFNEAHDQIQSCLHQLDLSGSISPEPSEIKNNLFSIEINTINKEDVFTINRDSGAYTEVEISEGSIHIFSGYRESCECSDYTNISLEDWEQVKEFVDNQIKLENKH